MIAVFDFGLSGSDITNFGIAVICEAKSCLFFNFICTIHITGYFLLIFFKSLIAHFFIIQVNYISFGTFMFEIFVVSVSNLALILGKSSIVLFTIFLLVAVGMGYACLTMIDYFN